MLTDTQIAQYKQAITRSCGAIDVYLEARYFANLGDNFEPE